MADVSVRAALPGDVHDIARVHVKSWLDTYRDLLPPEALRDVTLDLWEGIWSKRLARADDPRFALVATRHDEIVGYVFSGPDGSARACGEVFAIHLVPVARGAGLGRILLEVAVQRLAELGCSSVRLWVVEGNLKARQFYEHLGFKPDGASKATPSHGIEVCEVRYSRPT